jgi:hypothetical protein
VYSDKRLTAPEIDTIIENIYNHTYVQNISVYPNPSHDAFHIQFEMLIQTDYQMEIFNMTGDKIYTQHMPASGPGFKTIFWNGDISNGAHADNGLYFCRISTLDESVTIKLMKQ